jgi:hypothetical protein
MSIQGYVGFSVKDINAVKLFTPLFDFIKERKWSNSISYINSRLAQMSVFVPVIGYLILFNDSVVDLLNFSQIIGSEADDQSVQKGQTIKRLRYVYFGLIFLGGSNLIYLWRRPNPFRVESNIHDYVSKIFNFGTFEIFRHIYKGTIAHPSYVKNSFIEKEWAEFCKKSDMLEVGFDVAKGSHSSLLKEILIKRYSICDRERRTSLYLCLLLSSLGYFLLFIPSADAFLQISLSVISSFVF